MSKSDSQKQKNQEVEDSLDEHMAEVQTEIETWIKTGTASESTSKLVSESMAKPTPKLVSESMAKPTFKIVSKKAKSKAKSKEKAKHEAKLKVKAKAKAKTEAKLRRKLKRKSSSESASEFTSVSSSESSSESESESVSGSVSDEEIEAEVRAKTRAIRAAKNKADKNSEKIRVAEHMADRLVENRKVEKERRDEDDAIVVAAREAERTGNYKDYNKLKREKEQTCRGRSNKGAKCRYAVKDDNTCCIKHADMEEYTDEMFQNLRSCKSCKRWRYWDVDDKDICMDCQKIEPTDDRERCQEKGCNIRVTGNNKFCDRNHSYLEGYTKEMLKNRKKCHGCPKSPHIALFNGHKTCNLCQERCAKNREKNRKIAKAERANCGHEGCPNKVKDITKTFCNIHVSDQRKLDAKREGKKLCARYNRRCPNLLDINDPRSHCEECLAMARPKDRARHQKKLDAVKSKATDTRCCCIGCNNLLPLDQFETHVGKMSNKCNTCRKIDNEHDAYRIRANTQTNEKEIEEIERVAIRRGYKFELTFEEALQLILRPCHYCDRYYECTNVYGKKYSQMGIDRLDSKGNYTMDNVTTACAVCNRMKHAYGYEQFIEACYNIFCNFGSENDWEDMCDVKHFPLDNYIRDAKRRGLQIDLTEDEFEDIISKRCYYCDNMNQQNQIGIDRVDPALGYTHDNTLVACCGMCNNMKVDTSIDEFYNNILTILLCHNRITQNEYDTNFRVIENSPDFELVNETLMKIYGCDRLDIHDRADIYDFQQPSQYYIDNTWSGFDITRFEPELEFCTTVDQISTWMYYRLAISHYFPNEYSSTDILILIRDKFTKKYVGIIGLSKVPFRRWNDNTSLDRIVRHSNIYFITTCLTIPTFACNFDGRTLATMLTLSREVYDYMASKNIIVAGLVTFALTDECFQYDQIASFDMVGYTKNRSDAHSVKVNHKIYNTMKNIMKQKRYPITTNKMDNIRTYSVLQGIIDATVHEVKRAIYFGTIGENAMEYLTGKTNVFVPGTLPTVTDITKVWYTTFVIPMINYHIERNNFMIRYDYDTYYVDETSHERNIMKKIERKSNPNLEQYNNEKQSIVTYWFQNPDMSWKELENYLKKILPIPLTKIISKGSIEKYILQNDYTKLDSKTKTCMEMYIKQKRQLMVDTKLVADRNTRVDAILDREHRYIENMLRDSIMINIKKSNLFITTQMYDNINTFARFAKIDSIATGTWIIAPNSPDKNVLIDMVHCDCNNPNIFKDKRIKVSNIEFESLDTIFKIGITQNDEEPHHQDISVLDASIKVTRGDKIFVDVNHVMQTNKLCVTVYRDRRKPIESIIRITIAPMNVLHKNSITNSQCTCDSCMEFLLMSTPQRNVYKSAYDNLQAKKDKQIKKINGRYDSTTTNHNEHDNVSIITADDKSVKEIHNEPIEMFNGKIVKRGKDQKIKKKTDTLLEKDQGKKYVVVRRLKSS